MKPSRWTEETPAVPLADTASETWAPAASVIMSAAKVKQKMRILADEQMSSQRCGF
jgi:hypothetical protein